MDIPTGSRMVHPTFGIWAATFEDASDHFQSNDDKPMDLRPDCSIKLPVKLVDEFKWKTKTQLHIISYDVDLQQFTIGKKLVGEEAIIAAEKVSELFS